MSRSTSINLDSKVGWGELSKNYTVEMRLNDGARDDRLPASLPDVVEVQVCHGEFVLELPPGATRLASKARDPRLAFAYGPAAWGIQFHPEFERDILVSCIRECSDRLRCRGQNPAALIKSSSNTPRAKALLRRFGQILSARGSPES
jgi:GMP synthase (glutamine-hydrolysing)